MKLLPSIIVVLSLSLSLLPLAFSATASVSGNAKREKESDSPCNKQSTKQSCYATHDSDDSPCVWCSCKAIPSECLTQDQSKQVPPGVFECSTPSRMNPNKHKKTVLERMSIQQQNVDDTFCDVNSKSGYVAVNQSSYDQHGEDKHLFFWMFEKRANNNQNHIKDHDIPFIIWLTGGPGCSSSLALLTENGPCSVNPDGLGQTTLNPYSWTQTAHVLWLDQPAGVGFSYGQETDTNEDMISEDAYWFLQKFMQANPKYSSNPLFIIGESYGGHYAPAIAHTIWKYNQNIPAPDAIHLNLAGVAVGNGLTAPEEQYKWYPEMAYNNSHGIQVISETEYDAMKEVVPKCTALIHECNSGNSAIDSFACQSAFLLCNVGLTSPYQATGLNPYDIREQCKVPPLCYDFSFVTSFMNSDSTKKALGITSKSRKWESCNMGINLKFHVDWMKDFSHYIADLINDGIPALIYAGDVDFICNYLGNQAWTYNLQWSGGDDFRAVTPHDWNGVGMARTHDSGVFTFLQVYDAGHMVPSDQPKVALDMITTFVSGQSF